MSRTLRLAVLIVSGSILAGCDSNDAREQPAAVPHDSNSIAATSPAVPVTPVSLSTSSTAQIAETALDGHAFAVAVADRLREAETVLLSADITLNKASVRVNSTMRFQFLTTSVTHAGRAIAEFRLEHGTLEERGEFKYTSGSNEPSQVQTKKYTPPFPDGTDSAYFSSPESCLYGSYMRSWAGRDSYFAGFLEKRISSGERQPDMFIGNERCRVIQHRQQTGEAPDAYVRIDEFVVAEESKLLKQWNTRETNPTSNRSRTFEIQVISNPSPVMATTVAR